MRVPERAARHEIPLSGRIVGVADVFDALTHVRPYKGAWPIERSADEIVTAIGIQFDPDVVDTFEKLDPHELAGFSPTDRATALRAVG